MVISFEEKERKRIEQTGMTIIQAKRVLYKFKNFAQDVWEQLKQYINSLNPEQKAKLLGSLKDNNGDFDWNLRREICD